MYVFPPVKNDVVLINFIILGEVWGMLPQENFLMFQPLRLFLAASEHSNGEYPLVPLYFKSNVIRIWDMSPIPRVAQSFS